MFKFIECRRITIDFPNYISGILSIERVASVDKHIAACSNCARLLNEDKLMQRLLAPMREVGPTPDLTARLAARISVARRHPLFFVPSRTFAFSGAAAAIVIVRCVTVQIMV